MLLQVSAFLKGNKQSCPVIYCFIGTFQTGSPASMLLCFVNLFYSARYCATIHFSEMCYKVNMFCAVFQTDPRHCKLDLQ